MKQLTCEMCGSTDLLKENGVFVCQSCGCKYSVEEAKKMMIEGTVEVTGKVQADRSNEVEALLKRAVAFLKQQKWDKADKYFEDVLDIDPENSEAYLGKLMVAFMLRDTEEFIASRERPIESNENYIAAKKYANDKTLVLLKKREEYQKTPYSIKDDVLLGVNPNLETFSIPEGVVCIGKNAFRDCFLLTEVTIPNSVQMICEYAFCGCTALKQITIPNSVRFILAHAFDGCATLEHITIPNSVSSIYAHAFDGCESLTQITTENIGRIICSRDSEGVDDDEDDDRANSDFYDSWIEGSSDFCPTTINIPMGTTSIDSKAFSCCRSLIQINIPSSVTSIGAMAFSDCRSLTQISIPNSVTSIGNLAFSHCSSLTQITLPNGVTSIRNGVFSDCHSLTQINIPNSVTLIDDFAFSRCSSLTQITWPNSLTSIRDGAFEHCSSLTQITLPNGVTSLGRNAFRHCSSLTQITLPNSVTSIGDGAFEHCSSLTQITLPNGVTSLGKETFYSCDSLTRINLPNSVTAIGNEAFAHCPSLTQITLPNSVTSIGDQAFIGCDKLSHVTILSDKLSVGYNAFLGCELLKKLTLSKILYQGMCYDEYFLWNLFNRTVDTIELSNGKIIDAVDGKIKSGVGCYIATYVYGSYDCPQVWTLRRYRDNTLGSTWYGRLFIRTYYAISPTLVKWFGKTNWFKKFWKGKLDRMVEKLQANGVEATPYEDKNW